MAFVMKFSDDDDNYANVDSSVSARSGRWDDVMLVKALLKLVYSPKGPYKSPLRTPLTVNSRFDNSTATLIKHYQSTLQKRKRPDGIVSRASGSIQAAQNFTIIGLQIHANFVLAALGSGPSWSVLQDLRTKYPALVVPLSEKAAPGTLSEVVTNP